MIHLPRQILSCPHMICQALVRLNCKIMRHFQGRLCGQKKQINRKECKQLPAHLWAEISRSCSTTLSVNVIKLLSFVSVWCFVDCIALSRHILQLQASQRKEELLLIFILKNGKSSSKLALKKSHNLLHNLCFPGFSQIFSVSKLHKRCWGKIN